jgi:hypothetical protein
MALTLHDLRCRGCGQRIGVTTANRSLSVYCLEPSCPHLPAANENDTRDAIIVTLSAVKKTPQELAKLFGLTRQRVLQIVGK